MNEIKAVIVDDEFLNRELLALLIEKYAPEIKILSISSNLGEGRVAIRNLKPDLVFLDIKMPDGNGFELLKEFPERDFEVIFVTGFDNYSDRAFSMMAFDYVIKPIDIEKLEETLIRVCKKITAKR